MNTYVASMSQEFGGSLAECYWLGISHEVTVKVLARTAVI